MEWGSLLEAFGSPCLTLTLNHDRPILFLCDNSPLSGGPQGPSGGSKTASQGKFPEIVTWLGGSFPLQPTKLTKFKGGHLGPPLQKYP